MKHLALLALLCAAACDRLGFTPMQFESQGTALVATGDIDGRTLERFEAALAAHPDTQTLVLQYVGGSVDDEANLILSRKLRQLGLKTHVPSGGMIASGGTDLFLAGTERSIAPGACIGVHSWSGQREGSDYPKDHEEHRPYLAYYAAMGIPAAFYWFTLEAAPADGMHWMTAAEINRFSMTTHPAKQLTTGAACDER